ncbi:hypothetical protein GF324_06850, partial [bacterium]|nr:hypothetical protein [bacterium]
MLKRQSVRIALLSAALFVLTLAFIVSCGKMEGDIDQNQAPEVSFTTVPVNQDTFSFAPVIYWKGNDPDGFVEHYSYADITDSAAIENPVDYINRIPEEAWTDTIATQARIYLLTEAGETKEHVFYVRCVDNEGAFSEVKYRTFFRENNAPNIPRVGRPSWNDELFDTTVYVQDTLFTKNEPDNIWTGIDFTWRGSDPDDKALYQIPLEYQTVLVKSPGDTVFVSQWDDDQNITLSGLSTGFYTLYV